MTEAELNINIQSNQGKAEYQRSIQQAAQIRALAEAEAEKIARIGIAQALATEEQVRAYGGPQFQVTQQVLNRFSEAIQQSKVDVVPQVLSAPTRKADPATSCRPCLPCCSRSALRRQTMLMAIPAPKWPKNCWQIFAGA